VSTYGLSNNYLRILSTIADCGAFTLLELSLSWADEIDTNLDMFSNKFFAQKFPSFLGIVSLFCVSESDMVAGSVHYQQRNDANKPRSSRGA
jgi:hypothetical protein